MDEWTDCQQSKIESSCSTFVPLVVNAVIFLIVVLIILFFVYNRVAWHVRNCASSAKSSAIVFDDYESYITVPGLPKENGVPVKLNVILLRFPQANLFLAKIIVLDLTGACFDAIVHPDRVTSERAETSVTETPENKGIRVERYSHKYSSVAKIHHDHWNHMVTKSDMFSKRIMFYFVYSSFA